MSDNFSNWEKDWRERLNNHAADVPNYMFDRIDGVRLSESWKKQLKETESEVPNDMFERINAARLSGTWKKQLKETESKVPKEMFERIENVLDKENLQEKINNYASEVPNNMFGRVMEARQPETPRRPLAVLSLLLLLFLGMLVTTTILKKSPLRRYNKKEINQQIRKENQEENKNEENKNKVENNIKEQLKQQSLVKKDIVVAPSTGSNFGSTGNENKSSVVATNPMNVNEKKAEKHVSTLKNNYNKILGENKLSTISSSNLKPEDKISIGVSNEIFKTGVRNGENENKFVNAPTENFKPEIEKSITDKNPAALFENKDGVKNEKTISENDNLNSATLDLKKEKNNLLAINTLPVKKSFLKLKNIFVSPCNGPGDGCPTFGPQMRYNPNKGFFVNAYVGPEYVTRKLTAKSLDFADYSKARDTTERPQYAFNAGVGFGYEFGNGIVLMSGVSYSAINETAQFDSLGVGKIEFTVNIQPDGQRDTTEQILTNGIFRKTRYNQYSDLNIPLQIGYDIILKNNWSVMLKAGGGINLTAWRKADILGSDFKLLNQTGSTATPVFKNNIGGYIGGSIAVYKAVDEHLQIGLEPSVRYYLSSFTQTAYPLSQTYLNFGINATAKWRF